METGQNKSNGAREAVVGKLKALHTDEEIIYSGCVINCGAGHCVHKVRRKNGKITAIEPDELLNSKVPSLPTSTLPIGLGLN